MSMAKTVTLLCDKCGESKYAGIFGEGTRAVRVTAKSQGWKLGKSRDFCPSCRKDIEAEIKEAAAGNI